MNLVDIELASYISPLMRTATGILVLATIDLIVLTTIRERSQLFMFMQTQFFNHRFHWISQRMHQEC